MGMCLVGSSYPPAFEEAECGSDVGDPVDPLDLPALLTGLGTEQHKPTVKKTFGSFET